MLTYFIIGISIVVVIAIALAVRSYYKREDFKIGDEVLVNNQYPGEIVEIIDENDTMIVNVELPKHLITRKN